MNNTVKTATNASQNIFQKKKNYFKVEMLFTKISNNYKTLGS